MENYSMDDSQRHSTYYLENDIPNETKASTGTPKSMADIPPKVIADILKFLVKLDNNRSNTLSYRIANSTWKDIMDQLLNDAVISGGNHTFFDLRRIFNQDPTTDSIQKLPEPFSCSKKPFPFKALVLNQHDTKTYPFCGPFIFKNEWIPISEIMPRFASNLTTFSLVNVASIDTNVIPTILRFMPSLKTLCFKNIYLNDGYFNAPFVTPIFPSLQYLTRIQVESSIYSQTQQNAAISNVLYLLIILSYADQLESLSLNTIDPFPALKQRKAYFIGWFHISSTSSSAFTKLRELKLSQPARSFLFGSRFPNLERLSICISKLDELKKGDRIHDIQDIAVVINKFRKTLKHLSIDASWNKLIGDQNTQLYHLHGTLPLRFLEKIDGPCQMMKSIEIHYPTWHLEDLVMTTFIHFFPTIKEIHFIYFPNQLIATKTQLDWINKVVKFKLPILQPKNIKQLKSKLATVNQEMIIRNQFLRQLQYGLLRSLENLKLRMQIENHIRDFNDENAKERDLILFQMTLLGVKKQNVVVEQLLQSKQIWVTCPCLHLVTVNHKGTRTGDVCVFHKQADIYEK